MTKSPQNLAPSHGKLRGTVKVLVVLCVFGWISQGLFSGTSIAQENYTGPVAVPAEFVRDIKVPGLGETILRPSAMHFDRFNDEILVGDSGNNRILIFGSNGVFNFSFPLNEIMNIPRDIATDPEGFIYVLGSDKEGPVLFRFDFDGEPQESIPVPRVLDGIPVDLRYLAISDEGILFALDHQGRRILVIGQNDSIDRIINLERDSEISEKMDEGTAGGVGAYALGSMSCSGNTLYIPISNVGSIHTYSTDGEFLGSIGHFGSKPGSLNFPVAVEVSPEGLILVLDRTRYCVVCYSPDKTFLGEFGGKGISPGWFMGPSLLSVPSADKAIVGQVFRNKIQVCQVPTFIRAKAGRIPSEQTAVVPDNSGVAIAVGIPQVKDQRRSLAHSVLPHRNDEEFSPSDSSNAPKAQSVSLTEVSQ